MTASPEVWRFLYNWMAFYVFWMAVVAIMTYEGSTGFGWFLKFFN